MYIGIYIHAFVHGIVCLVVDDYVIFAAWKVEEAKVPLGVGVHVIHRRAAVLQFDEDLVGRDIAPGDSDLSDDSAELLQLRTECAGQKQSEENEKARTKSAEHGTTANRKRARSQDPRAGPEKRTG